MPLCAAGHTTLIVSHDTNVIEKFCTRALLLEGGRVLMEGPATNVCERYTRLLTDGHSLAGQAREMPDAR